MNLCFKEYLSMLEEKTGLKLDEGYYWLDNSIIKAFDIQGNLHKLYRIVVNNDLSIQIKKLKGYSDESKLQLASWHDVVKMNEEHLQQIEIESLGLITDVINKYNGYVPKILTSGGKDSSVVLHLVRRIIPDAQAIFNNTTLDCADTYLHIKEIDNVYTINPKEGFYQWRKRLDFVPARFARACCSIFKENAMVNDLDCNNKYLFFLGMRNEESATRSNYADMWKNDAWSDNWQGCLPIRKWTEIDVWLYMLWRKINFNSKYRKGYSRCGCAIACPFANKSTWLLDEYFYPKMRERWLNILKEDFIKNNKWIVMNCTLEEYTSQAWNGGILREEPTQDVLQEFAEYNHLSLDNNVYKQYFNKYCANGCTRGNKLIKIKDKNTLAMNLKFYGRNTNKFFCKKCFLKEQGMTNDDWDNHIQRFKDSGCALF